VFIESETDPDFVLGAYYVGVYAYSSTVFSITADVSVLNERGERDTRLYNGYPQVGLYLHVARVRLVLVCCVVCVQVCVLVLCVCVCAVRVEWKRKKFLFRTNLFLLFQSWWNKVFFFFKASSNVFFPSGIIFALFLKMRVP